MQKSIHRSISLTCKQSKRFPRLKCLFQAEAILNVFLGGGEGNILATLMIFARCNNRRKEVKRKDNYYDLVKCCYLGTHIVIHPPIYLASTPISFIPLQTSKPRSPLPHNCDVNVEDEQKFLLGRSQIYNQYAKVPHQLYCRKSVVACRFEIWVGLFCFFAMCCRFEELYSNNHNMKQFNPSLQTSVIYGVYEV